MNNPVEVNGVVGIGDNKEVKNEMPFYIEKKVEDTIVEIAMQYTDSFKEYVVSFANNIFLNGIASPLASKTKPGVVVGLIIILRRQPEFYKKKCPATTGH